MQVKINKWKRFPLLPCQYLNKWIPAVPITVNSRTNFHLLILFGFCENTQEEEAKVLNEREKAIFKTYPLL